MNALLMNAQIKFIKEECAKGTGKGPRGRKENALLMDAQIKL